MADTKLTYDEFVAQCLLFIPEEQHEKWLSEHLIFPTFWNEEEWEVAKIENNKPNWGKWLKKD